MDTAAAACASAAYAAAVYAAVTELRLFLKHCCCGEFFPSFWRSSRSFCCCCYFGSDCVRVILVNRLFTHLLFASFSLPLPVYAARSFPSMIPSSRRPRRSALLASSLGNSHAGAPGSVCTKSPKPRKLYPEPQAIHHEFQMPNAAQWISWFLTRADRQSSQRPRSDFCSRVHYEACTASHLKRSALKFVRQPKYGMVTRRCQFQLLHRKLLRLNSSTF